jgi:hypothetical protein
LLFIGDDWAEGHHDVVLQDEAGKTLARRRLPEGADGIARFHELVASCWGEHGEPDPAQVVVVIETDRGPWVKALAAAGYRVYAVNPKQAARHKETITVSGKKDDFFDAACLADMGRTRRHQIRELAAGSDIAEAVKIAARAHQKLVWERTRHLLRTRSALREYFPAALEAYADCPQRKPALKDRAHLYRREHRGAGVIAIAEGRSSPAGTLTGVSAVLVAVRIGVTVPAAGL